MNRKKFLVQRVSVVKAGTSDCSCRRLKTAYSVMSDLYIVNFVMYYVAKSDRSREGKVS